MREEGVSFPRAVAAIRAALQTCILYFRARNGSLWARFASRLAASSGKVTPHGALRAHPKPCTRT
jgi:hypothetical protein